MIINANAQTKHNSGAKTIFEDASKAEQEKYPEHSEQLSISFPLKQILSHPISEGWQQKPRASIILPPLGIDLQSQIPVSGNPDPPQTMHLSRTLGS
jgi:hypothetical protein